MSKKFDFQYFIIIRFEEIFSSLKKYFYLERYEKYKKSVIFPKYTVLWNCSVLSKCCMITFEMCEKIADHFIPIMQQVKFAVFFSKIRGFLNKIFRILKHNYSFRKAIEWYEKIPFI